MVATLVRMAQQKVCNRFNDNDGRDVGDGRDAGDGRDTVTRNSAERRAARRCAELRRSTRCTKKRAGTDGGERRTMSAKARTTSARGKRAARATRRGLAECDGESDGGALPRRHERQKNAATSSERG